MSRTGDWLLYGAYGYTGRLLAAEAMRTGHRPILSGRNEAKLRELRSELAAAFPAPPLPIRPLSLDEPERLKAGFEDVDLVLNAAGPFIETARPVMDACLAAGSHYLDVTGEIPVFEEAFSLDSRARAARVVLMPGVGLDVIPTDGAAALLARALPSATRLELALHSPGRPSAGTMQTVVEGIPGGLRVRRGGELLRVNPGRREFRRWIDFGPEVDEGPMKGRLGGRRSVGPYSWGDLATAWRTTGIDHITCYLTAPRSQVRLLPVVLPILRFVLRAASIRRFLRSRIARGPAGPTEERRTTGRTRVWGRVEDDNGRSAEVVFELPEGYRFTALAGVRAVEAVLERSGEGSDPSDPSRGEALTGTLTPAGAFGPNWVLGLPEVVVIRGP